MTPKNIFWLGVTYNIGKGDRVAFWKDIWCDILPLKMLFSLENESCSRKLGMVTDFWSRGRWRVGLRNRLGCQLLRNNIHGTQLKDSDNVPIWR